MISLGKQYVREQTIKMKDFWRLLQLRNDIDHSQPRIKCDGHNAKRERKCRFSFQPRPRGSSVFINIYQGAEKHDGWMPQTPRGRIRRRSDILSEFNEPDWFFTGANIEGEAVCIRCSLCLFLPLFVYPLLRLDWKFCKWEFSLILKTIFNKQACIDAQIVFLVLCTFISLHFLCLPLPYYYITIIFIIIMIIIFNCDINSINILLI